MFEPTAEQFDRAAVPSEIDPETAKLIRAAVMSGDPQRLRRAWQLMAARADLVRSVQSGWR